MLTNSGLTLNSDSGTGTISLGGSLLIQGTSTQGISTSLSGAAYTVTASNASSTQKGVASFDSASFTATAGVITLNTVDVAHGGTGATSYPANQVLYGNTTSPLSSDAALKFTPSGANGTLAIGGANGATLATNGVDTILTSLATNSNIRLMPNGAGAVIIGPAASGLLTSTAAAPLEIKGYTTLKLTAVGGALTLALPTGTTSKVSITGPSAAQYATNLAANDLVNKQYVDDAIISGATSGSLKAYQAIVPLNTNGTIAIGTPIPAGSTIMSVKVKVTSIDASAALSIGTITDGVAAFMTTIENDPQTVGVYLSETYFIIGASEQINATVTSSTGTGTGSCLVMFEYQVA